MWISALHGSRQSPFYFCILGAGLFPITGTGALPWAPRVLPHTVQPMLMLAGRSADSSARRGQQTTTNTCRNRHRQTAKSRFAISHRLSAVDRRRVGLAAFSKNESIAIQQEELWAEAAAPERHLL